MFAQWRRDGRGESRLRLVDQQIARQYWVHHVCIEFDSDLSGHRTSRCRLFRSNIPSAFSRLAGCPFASPNIYCFHSICTSTIFTPLSPHVIKSLICPYLNADSSSLKSERNIIQTFRLFNAYNPARMRQKFSQRSRLMFFSICSLSDRELLDPKVDLSQPSA